MVFDELELRDEILDALQELGFEQPTPIQQETIPQLLNDWRDLIGLAQTGTGKTAAFGLPLIQMTDFDCKYVQGLVIAPTRELCVQISSDFKKFTKYIPGAEIATIYGGANITNQAREIKRGAQLVVATPGRLIDMLKRKLVKLDKVQVAVLDEADEMLNMGFKEDIDRILDSTPETKSVWLFSATMSKQVTKIASNYMNNPIEVTVGSKNSSAPNLKHVYYSIREKDRYYALKRILDYNPNIYGLIFCRTKRNTQDVADKLRRDGYNAEPIHGDLSQGQRDSVMKKFRDKTLQILVATDVAARGIDVNDITHVVNYNLPEDVENYTHRSGRTARAGKHGISVAFITPKEVGKIKAIERQLKTQFIHEQIPSGREVCREQLFSLIDNVKTVEVKEDEINEYLPAIMDQLDGFEKEDIIKRFVSAEFNHFLEYYGRSFDINAEITKQDRDYKLGARTSGRNRSRDRDENKTRFYLNKGLSAGLNKGAILRIICDASGVDARHFGRIDPFKEFSFIDVDKTYADQVLNSMKSCNFKGQTLRIEFASGGDQANKSKNKPRGKFKGVSKGYPKRKPAGKKKKSSKKRNE